jgi:hypothetical protein
MAFPQTQKQIKNHGEIQPLCQSAFHCYDKIPVRNQLKGGKFYFGHSLGGFSVWLAGSIPMDLW